MKLTVPTVMINSKTYIQASGKDAELLAKICKRVSSKSKKNVSLCVQASDLYRCSKQHKFILAQHVDVEKAGGHTGKIHIKSLKENGAMGVLINHTENRISMDNIMMTIALVQEAKMAAIVCVKSPKEAGDVATLHPDAIAIEPPALIGGDMSVTSANPKIISNSVKAVHKVNPTIAVLCGAGVKNDKDVTKALELGTTGVLVASGVTKAKNQKKAVENLVKGLA